jgi:hypothetical protein
MCFDVVTQEILLKPTLLNAFINHLDKIPDDVTNVTLIKVLQQKYIKPSKHQQPIKPCEEFSELCQHMNQLRIFEVETDLCNKIQKYCTELVEMNTVQALSPRSVQQVEQYEQMMNKQKQLISISHNISSKKIRHETALKTLIDTNRRYIKCNY